MDHVISGERRVKEIEPAPDGWRQFEPAEVRVICTCGLRSEWLERPAARAIAVEHARENGVPCDLPEDDAPQETTT